MVIKIYGPTASRAWRTVWLLNELGIPFERAALHIEDVRKPDFWVISPNGKVPVLVDGHFKIFESMAINLYLAAKYNKDSLFPMGIEDQALCSQWSFWGVAELETPLLTVLVEMFMVALEKRQPEKEDEARRALTKPFVVLNAALKSRDYLLGPTFTVADLNLASICAWTKPIKYEFGPYPNVATWLGRCLSRPAYKAARAAP
jgi:glutathione S-transferase